MARALTVYARLRRAIIERRQVVATYGGVRREFCPHVLGWKGDAEHCLGYQFGGDTSGGPIVPGSPENWRCFSIEGLSRVSLREGPWFSAANWDRRQTCVDRVDVEVGLGGG